MKGKTNLKGVLIILLLIVQVNSYSTTFENERVEKVYGLLPKNLKASIDSLHSNHLLNWSDSSAIRIKVLVNAEKQLTHIGFDLRNENNINKNFIDAYQFIEYCLLNLLLLDSGHEKQEFVKKMQLKFYLNDKIIQFKINDTSGFLENLPKLNFSLKYNDYYFQAEWIEPNGKQFKMLFPTELYLLKGMDKVDLELQFLNNLKHVKNNPETFKIKNDSITRIDSNFYIQKGDYFETDNFRSDIYLQRLNESFQPCFSVLYPIESFSNLFICNLDNSFKAEIDFKLYKNKRTEKYPLKYILNQLSKNKEIYFGVYSTSETTMKATVIYFDPVFKYIHMLIAEAENEKIFNDRNSELKMSLYLYIPRAEVDKDNILRKQEKSIANFN